VRGGGPGPIRKLSEASRYLRAGQIRVPRWRGKKKDGFSSSRTTSFDGRRRTISKHTWIKRQWEKPGEGGGDRKTQERPTLRFS